MYEVTAVAVGTEALLQEPATHLGLVLAVGLVVLLQLLQSMRELAPSLIRTVTLLHELFAQLRLLLVRSYRQPLAGGLLSREGVAHGLDGLQQGRNRSGGVGGLPHAFFLG